MLSKKWKFESRRIEMADEIPRYNQAFSDTIPLYAKGRGEFLSQSRNPIGQSLYLAIDWAPPLKKEAHRSLGKRKEKNTYPTTSMD